MKSVYGKVAGIDVHKQMLAVVVADRNDPEHTRVERRFGTTTKSLGELREWLRALAVEEVAMESTAQYWKTVWLELEGHFRLYLAQARSTAAPRGRKSDFADALRIVKRLLSQDLTLSYVPDAEQRCWRLLARTRTQLIEDRVRIQSQMECLLEEGRIKLSSVVSDLLGVTSRIILRALAQGAEDISQVAARASRYVRASEEQLVEALSGQLQSMHRELLGMHLDRIESLDRDIAKLEKQLSGALSEHQEAVKRLCEVPGISVVAGQQILAEVGPQAEAFASAGKLASWIGVCPGREESAGQSRTDRSPKGNRAMRRLLTQIAFAAVRQKGSFFQYLFRRLIPRLGVKKSIWAVAHRMTRLIWKLLHERVDYKERGTVPADAKSLQRRKQRCVKELRRLGYVVVLSQSAAQ